MKDRPIVDDSYEFVMSLYKNDLVHIKNKRPMILVWDETKIDGNGNEVKEKFTKEVNDLCLYYNTVTTSLGALTLFLPNAKNKRIINLGNQSLEIFDKYEVDILGNIHKVKHNGKEPQPLKMRQK